MTYEDVYKTLTLFIEGDVSIDLTDRQAVSTDWSLFKIIPDLVVYPKHSSDIQKLVNFVNEYNKINDTKLSITPRAAGSGMSGGSLNHSIVLDVTRYMNHFRDIQSGDYGTQTHREGFPYPITGLATAEPGMKYIPFEEMTVKQGLLMPVFPASRKLCALGGMVGNNSAGEKSLKYGQNKDFVYSLKVVLADRNEYDVKPLTYKELSEYLTQDTHYSRILKDIYNLLKEHWNIIQNRRPVTSKNSAGYFLWDIMSAPTIEAFEQGEGYFDPTKLFVGAQGTTGIITEITYKLVPYEDKQELLVMFVNDINELPKVVQTLRSYDIETIELYDDHTFSVGIKFWKDFVKDKGFFQSIRYALRFLPEFWMSFTGGIPKYVVLAESVDSNEERVQKEVQEELKKVQEELPHVKSFIVRGAEAQKYWDFRHDSFKLLTEHSMKSRKKGSGTRTAPFIDDIAVPPENLPRFLPKIVAILDQYQDEFMYTIAGHLGDGNLHIIPLADMNSETNKAKIVEIADQVYALALQYGGTITAEHNDGIIRTPYLEDMFGEQMIKIFEKVKNIMDPDNIFNPGKKVGLTKSDIYKYMA